MTRPCIVVSILVFVELAFEEVNENILTGKLVFQSLFLWNSPSKHKPGAGKALTF